MSAAPLRVAVPAVAVGGVLGSLARFGITDAAPPHLGFPWAVFAINLAGSALLAALPLIAAVRRTPWLAVFLGTGVMGGFTTMSAASEQTVYLLDHGRVPTAVLYCLGTLGGALFVVALVTRLVNGTLPPDAVE